jgi:putative peptide zinc metalloprotease protein
MTVVNGPSADTNGAGGTAPPTPTSEVPVRADGVQLIGEMKGSGYREPPALARRSDGQTIQLTPLLYLVLAAVDGRRDFAAIGEAVGAALGKSVSADNVRTLVEGQLRPAGLVVDADGTQQRSRCPTRCWRSSSSTPSPTTIGLDG